MSSVPRLECACATIRRTARLVTQLYSHEMGQNVEPTQFALLTVLSHRPGGGQSPLGRALGLDKTTMSRNLRLMERNGWIEGMTANDKRKRGYRITPLGTTVLAATTPGWTRAQARLRKALEPDEWESILKMLDRVAAVAQELL